MRARSDGGGSSGAGVNLAYMPALDGVRAVSILGIMLYHGGFSWAGGGLISVDVFFVLSGFLITTLLLKEWERNGTIRLSSFWARRARRLLPALFVLLGGIALYIWLFAPGGTQAEFRGDALSTLFYFGNWHQIFAGQSYFAQVSAQSPVLHTWTLAIEEQFYLVWPLVVLGVLKAWHSGRVLLVLAVLGTLASALEMALLFHPGADPSRLYYGTDTRAQDLLVGAVGAIVLLKRHPSGDPRTRACWSLVAAGAIGVFIWEWLTVSAGSNWLYRGGFLLSDVAVGVVILGVTLAPDGLPARALSVRPLTYVGRISYGLYLWHWPVFLVLDNARTGLVGWELFGLRFVVTFAIAVASWYLVEQPVRRLGFGAVRNWSWVPVGAAAAAGLLFVSAAGTEAASGVSSLGPGDPQASKFAYWIPSFPKSDHLQRVLFVGDSLSLYTGYWLAPYAARYGLFIGGRAQSGCGIATAVPYNLHGNVQYPIAPCVEQPALWQSDVDQFHPQVAVVIVGFWETLDRMYQGRWQHLGDPAFDAYETSKFEQAVSILSSRGARVVLMTAPYNDTGEQPDGQPWDEDSPARIDELNRIIKAVADRHPGVVSMLPLNKILDPAGHFTWKIGGKTIRTPEGIHTTKAAGILEAPIILPRLAAVAREPLTVAAPGAHAVPPNRANRLASPGNGPPSRGG
jgi:peptidoglycan/LPS O-acetylase OafA/YrhL